MSLNASVPVHITKEGKILKIPENWQEVHDIYLQCFSEEKSQSEKKESCLLLKTKEQSINHTNMVNVINGSNFCSKNHHILANLGGSI